ncbi:MAG: hypothetical protein IJ363_04620 [Clostridia bacterium]|nr:hypothetical protein [Clostridia bacterium]
MKQNQTEKAERLFTALGDLDPKTVASATAYIPKTAEAARKGSGRRILVAVLAATLCLCLVTVTVFAAVPSLRRMLNLPFLSEGSKQDTVPEGWVGIYTVEDLDNVRNDLDGKYILMNDLTFADGDAPFTPIGSRLEPFTGQFDGNGHVIRGLTIEVEQETPEIMVSEQTVNGVLHSYTYYDVKPTIYNIETQKVKPVWAGLFGYCGGEYAVETPYRGMISNLGIENARMTISNASSLSAGFIAGRAKYLAGCYVKDSTITVSGYTRGEADKAPVYIKAGGLIGDAELLDSCYVQNVTMTVTGLDELDSSPYDCLLGGLAGDAYTVVTSYSEACTVTADTDQVTKGDLWGHIHLLHRLMTESQFFTVYEKYYRTTHGLGEDDPLPDDWKKVNGSVSGKDEAAFLCAKFRSWYISKTLGETVTYLGFDFEHMDPAFLMGEFNPEMVMYIKDPTMTAEELMLLEAELSRKIGAEKLCEIMTCDNRKIGPLDCYTLDPATTYKKSDFAEFNFDTIWRMKEGRPVLRIFEE